MVKLNDIAGIAPKGHYTVSFDFNVAYPLKSNVLGRELLDELNANPDGDIIQDSRLRLVGFILDSSNVTVDQIIFNYVQFLSAYTNKNIAITLPNRDIETLRSIGYILAFAAPTALADEITRYENKLAHYGVPFIKERAFHPLSTFSQHYADIWVNKLDAAKLLNWQGSPAMIRSSDLVKFITR